MQISVVSQSIKHFKAYRHQDLKRKNGKLKDRKDIFVYIYSGEWESFWRVNSGGYTKDLSTAGIHTLAEAWMLTSHCGPEKEIFYLVIPCNELPEGVRG